MAGPVKSGVAAVTNLPWVINGDELSVHLKIPKVKLINGFIAVAYGIDELNDLDTFTLQQGEAYKKTDKPNAVVIGAGAGLGVAHRVWINDHYKAFSTEAGHTGFAPENEQQCQLLSWLQKNVRMSVWKRSCRVEACLRFTIFFVSSKPRRNRALFLKQ